MLQHIAASNGYENCVTLLLQFGADPNRKGTFSPTNDLIHFDNTLQTIT
jgi:hypothetical protein